MDEKITASEPLHGWTRQADRLYFESHLYIPDHQDLCIQIISNHHDHPTVGPFSQMKTIKLIRNNFHWPGLGGMVKSYINSCTNCACNKAPRHKPYGKLKQLPIPNKLWNSISMDFIEHLLAANRFTAILVIVDCPTKQSLFIPTYDTINSPQLAQLFLTHVFSKHGVPSHVTSDWGTKFVSHFFCSLGKLLQMELHFASGYHPEGNGQTEHINQVLEQYLRAYTNYQQNHWSTLLPLPHIAY